MELIYVFRLWQIQLHLLTHIPDFMTLQYLLSSSNFMSQISFYCTSKWRFHSSLSVSTFTIDFSFDFHCRLHFICYICHRLHFNFCATFMADFISLPSSYHRYHFIAILISTTNFISVFFMTAGILIPTFIQCLFQLEIVT